MYIPQTVTDTPTTVPSYRSVCPLGLIHPSFPPRKEVKAPTAAATLPCSSSPGPCDVTTISTQGEKSN